jgi:hypothetical protein
MSRISVKHKGLVIDLEHVSRSNLAFDSVRATAWTVLVQGKLNFYQTAIDQFAELAPARLKRSIATRSNFSSHLSVISGFVFCSAAMWNQPSADATNVADAVVRVFICEVDCLNTSSMRRASKS